MQRLGTKCQAYPMEGSGIFSAMNADEKTVNIIISYSGETGEMIRIEKILKSHHSPVISITSLGNNKIACEADINLFIDSRESLYHKIACYSSFESTHFLLNYIYSLIFSKNYNENLKFKVDYDRLTDTRKAHFPLDEKKIDTQ